MQKRKRDLKSIVRINEDIGILSHFIVRIVIIVIIIVDINSIVKYNNKNKNNLC